MPKSAAHFFDSLTGRSDRQGLKSFLQTIEKDFSDFARSQEGFLSHLADYVLVGAGKRVRPSLVYVCAQFGPAENRLVRQTALAVEEIHIATLIHDDLVDEAVLRRKKPTVGAKFGDQTAVLLGDYVFAQAYGRLASFNNTELLTLFSDTAKVMCAGEIEQLEHKYKFDITEKQYFSFLEKKTASLMAAACQAGGKLAGLSLTHLKAIESFGRGLGLAFQIIDDILDFEGEEDIVGKTLRTDLLHGKTTLPLIYYINHYQGDKKDLGDILNHPNGHISHLIQDVQKSGAMSYCRDKVRDLLKETEACLDLLPESPARGLLLDMSRELFKRNA